MMSGGSFSKDAQDVSTASAAELEENGGQISTSNRDFLFKSPFSDFSEANQRSLIDSSSVNYKNDYLRQSQHSKDLNCSIDNALVVVAS